MKWRRLATVLVVVLVVVLGGCGFFTKTGLETVDRREALQSQADIAKGETWETYDDLLAKVAQQVPAFGGMFPDKKDNGILYVYLLDTTPQVTAAVERAIVTMLGPIFPDLIPPREVRVLPAKYSFLRLKEWKDLAGRLFEIPGVVTLDIDDVDNQLAIGLEKMEIATRVEEGLVKLGIPREAVLFEETGLFQFNQELISHMRPVVGGLQINYPGYLCTLGFNATRNGVSGFVTASHCSATMGASDGTVYHQPTRERAGYRIGTETVDPPFVNRLWPTYCWPFVGACRASDANFVRYDSMVSFNRGYIARTDSIGSIVIDPWNPRFRITSKSNATVNQTVNRIGYGSGWRQGQVTHVCRDVSVGGGRYLLCQTFADYYSLRGDSGSPVFRITNSPSSGDVQLVGIHHGVLQDGTRVFSPIGYIEEELGTLNVCASGWSC